MLLTIKQVAETLGLSYEATRVLVRSGEIESVNVGKPNARRASKRVSPKALDKFLSRRGSISHVESTTKPSISRRSSGEVIEFF